VQSAECGIHISEFGISFDWLEKEETWWSTACSAELAPGEWLWSKIETEIRKSDSILVLWTKHGARSGDVREEIGIAVGVGKYEQIIPVVEGGEDLKGSRKGKEWAPLDRTDPKKGIIGAIEKILKEAEKKPPIPRLSQRT